MSNRPRPKLSEIAAAKALVSTGMSATAVGEALGRDHKTIQRWLASSAVSTPEIEELVQNIKGREMIHLRLLIDKALNHLHVLLDQGGMRAIETMAVADRCFNMRRLLEGSSTHNISHANLIEQLADDRKRLLQQLESLDGTGNGNA